MKFILILSLCFVYSATPSSAMGAGDFERNMERAHPSPSPSAKRSYWRPPFVTESHNLPLFLNVNITELPTEVFAAQNESSVAVNPLNPRNLIASAVDYRRSSATWVYVSHDGGRSWQNVELGRPYAGWQSTNDPSVAFSYDGRGYLCYGGFNRTQSQLGENGVFVAVTTDEGATWVKKHIPVIVHAGQQSPDSAFEDKYYIHVDNAEPSPWRGHLYIPWKRVINRDSSTQIVISKSTDGGLSWSVPVNISDRFPHTSEHATFGQSFPLARTDHAGLVHVVWNSGTESAVRYARSTDGGLTFSQPRVLHAYSPFGIKSTVAGQTNSRVKGVVRAEAYPTLVSDITEGPRRGWLYLAWAADRIPNVYFSRSTDGGDTWSTPKVVHSDTTNDQFWPWIALDETSGDIGVMYFDSRNYDDNIPVDCYVSLSTDGGDTWTDRRASDGINDLRNNPFSGNTFAGDYSGLAFHAGILYPTWVDTRRTAIRVDLNDVYTAIMDSKAPQAPAPFVAITLPEDRNSIALSWSKSPHRSFGQPLDSNSISYQLFRDGSLIAELPFSTIEYMDRDLTPYTLFTYEIQSIAGVDTSSRLVSYAYSGGPRNPDKPHILSIRGNANATVNFEVQLPVTRADGKTPLVNLAGLRISSDANVSTDFPISAADTGSVVELTFDARTAGWQRFVASTLDSDNNMSDSSNVVFSFTGSMYWRSETFDSLPRFYISQEGGRIPNSWALTPAFYKSPPYSFTDSPGRNYGARVKDTILLYPLMADLEPDEALQLRYHVAAFIHQSDTAFLEYSVKGIDGHWTQLDWWNAGKVERWLDTVKSPDAWRPWSSTIADAKTGDTVLLRLRFASNIINHSDGLYIDDIEVATVSSVANHDSPHQVSLYPQPASSNLILHTAGTRIPAYLWVRSMDGRDLTAEWHFEFGSISINVSHLSPGNYIVIVENGGQPLTRLFTVIR